jgi:hypothetical protein
MPNCPYCHHGLTDEEMYDWTEFDEKAIFYYIGVCPKCGREFQWNLVYYWDNEINNLEEIKELE